VLAGAYIFYKKAFTTNAYGGLPYVSYITGEIVEANYHVGWQD
jgi:hypothetical protein